MASRSVLTYSKVNRKQTSSKERTSAPPEHCEKFGESFLRTISQSAALLTNTLLMGIDSSLKCNTYWVARVLFLIAHQTLSFILPLVH